MGILDHRKTWRFRVNGSEQDCMAAFRQAFSTGGGLIARAKWDVRRSGNGAVAVYRGRAGLVKVATIMSSTASAEEDSAVGSEVKFEIEDVSAGTVTCAMWLSSGGSSLGFTSDARFFRPYMRAVEDQLRRVDSSVSVSKA
jgi:hypothetical protein